MPNRERQKGDRAEREVVKRWRESGRRAQRVPLSGSSGGEFNSDVWLEAGGDFPGWLIGEVKARADGDGWKRVAEWLGDNDILLLKADRKPVLVVLEMDLLLRLMGEGPTDAADSDEAE